MSKSNLPLAAAAAAMSMGPVAASAAEVSLQASGPVVELTVSETVSSSPDVVNLSAGVNALAPTASEALRQNAERMARVIAAIEGQGVAEENIRTSEIALSPEYEWNPTTQRQIFRGYQVSSTVQIRLHELPRTGRVLDALVTAGADEIGAISAAAGARGGVCHRTPARAGLCARGWLHRCAAAGSERRASRLGRARAADAQRGRGSAQRDHADPPRTSAVRRDDQCQI